MYKARNEAQSTRGREHGRFLATEADGECVVPCLQRSACAAGPHAVAPIPGPSIVLAHLLQGHQSHVLFANLHSGGNSFSGMQHSHARRGT